MLSLLKKNVKKLCRLYKPKTNKSNFIFSSSVSVITHLSSQALRLASNLILTRLLAPELFGIMSVIWVLITGLNLVSDIGLQQHFIYSKNSENRSYQQTIWSMQIIRGLLISIFLIFISFILYKLNNAGVFQHTSVYANTSLPVYIALMALYPLINGFLSINYYILRKKLLLVKIAKIDLTSQVIGLFVTILLAYIYKNIYALIIGSIFTEFLKVIISHRFNSTKTLKFGVNKNDVKEIFEYGKWIALSSISGFLLRNGDKLILGGLISAKLLGIYSIAFFLVNAIRELVMKLGTTVIFPSLSKVAKDNPTGLSDTYYRIRNVVDKITFLIFGILFFASNSIVDILYDARYEQAGWMLKILSISILFISYTLSSQCFLSIGKSRYISHVLTIRIIIFITLLPLFYNLYGLIGALYIIALNPLVSVIGNLYYMKKTKLLQITKEIKNYHFILIGLISGYFLELFLKSMLNIPNVK